MADTPRFCPQEFKDEAVALVQSSGRSVTGVARSFGRVGWHPGERDEQRAREERSRQRTVGALQGDLAELKRLRKENVQQDIGMENLRKVAAYFA